MSTTTDTPFEAEVRAMLHRRAGDVAPATPLDHALPTGIRVPLDDATPRRPWARVVAVAAGLAIVAGGAGLVARAGAGPDAGEPVRAEQPPASEAQASPGTPAAPEATTPTGPTDAPTVEGLPAGVDLATAPAFWVGDPGASVEVVTHAYLVDRLRLPPGGIPVGPLEVDGGDGVPAGFTVVRWHLVSEMEDLPKGTLVLRSHEGRWAVVAAVTEGVSLAQVRVEGDAVVGEIANDDINSLWVDVVDADGRPVPGSPEDGFEGADGRLTGTAGSDQDKPVVLDVPLPPGQPTTLQARLVGGSFLSITEVSLAG